MRIEFDNVLETLTQFRHNTEENSDSYTQLNSIFSKKAKKKSISLPF